MAMKNGSKNKDKISEKALLCPQCGCTLDQNLETLRRQLTAADAATASAARAFMEKRRHQRLELRTMVEVDGEKALLFNISCSGLLLSTPFYPRGPEVNITLDNGEQHFDLKGLIRWVSPKRSFSNLIDFGVEIHDPSPEYHEFIDQLLACYKNAMELH